MSDALAVPATDPEALQVLDPYAPTGQRRAGRRVELAVAWATKETVRDLAPHLRSLTYTDNLSGAADDLAFDVEDREGLWSGDWQPTAGDEVVARAKFAYGWFGYEKPVDNLRLGTYAHDKISLSGPPRVASLQCVSAPLATELRRRKRTRAWRGVSLKKIAGDIAQRAGLTLEWDGTEPPSYQKALQHDKSDLEFLEEQTKEIGRTLKVTEEKIVIYDEFKLDSGDAVGAIDFLGGELQRWSFDADDNERYGSCHITCVNPRTGKKIEYRFPPSGTKIPGLDDNGQTLELVIAISDAAEAAARAQSALRNANRFATTGKLTAIGDLGLVAGVVFDLKNAQKFSGKWIITKATHHLVGGYTVDLDIRRCLEGY
jgi:phage protein D